MFLAPSVVSAWSRNLFRTFQKVLQERGHFEALFKSESQNERMNNAMLQFNINHDLCLKLS